MDLSIKAPDIAAAPESLKQFSLGLCSPDHHHHCCCTITTITDSNVASGNIFRFLPISLLVLSLFLPVFYSWTPSYPSSPVLPSLLCFWLRLLSGRYSERLLEWQPMVEEEQMPKTTQEEDSKQRTDREKHNLDKVFLCACVPRPAATSVLKPINSARKNISPLTCSSWFLMKIFVEKFIWVHLEKDGPLVKLYLFDSPVHNSCSLLFSLPAESRIECFICLHIKEKSKWCKFALKFREYLENCTKISVQWEVCPSSYFFTFRLWVTEGESTAYRHHFWMLMYVFVCLFVF